MPVLASRRNQPMAGVEEDPQRAAVAPRRHPAVDEPLAACRLAVVVGLGIERPQLAAGGRVEGGHPVVRRAHVEHAVNHERRVLERAGKRAELRERLLAGLPFPRHAQPRHVLARDRREGRVLAAARVTAVPGPVVAGLPRSDAGRREAEDGHGCGRGEPPREPCAHPWRHHDSRKPSWPWRGMLDAVGCPNRAVVAAAVALNCVLKAV